MEIDLECPVCQEKPRPDELGKYGLCHPHGHTTCGKCFESLMKSGNFSCPICRGLDFTGQSHNVLVNTIFKQLSDQTKYNCRYCKTEWQGLHILEHESICNAHTVICPSCNCSTTYESILARSHPCKYKIVLAKRAESSWNFILDFNSIKNNKMKPALLFHPTKVSQYCVVLKNTEDGLNIYVYWLGKKEGITTDMTNSIVIVSACVYTKAGPLGRARPNPINFMMGDKPAVPNLIILKHWLQDWNLYSDTHKCLCKYKDPHMRISIELNKPL